MKVTWHTAKYVYVPILGICALQLTHPKCTHTAVNTHTVNTHPEQWAAIYVTAHGEQLGVRCLAQGNLSRGIEGGESAVHSLPHLQFLPARDSNPQPLDYESDSLTIRPRLPHKKNIYLSAFVRKCKVSQGAQMFSEKAKGNNGEM